MAVPAAVWAVVVLVPVVTALVLGCGLLLGGSARQQPLRAPLNADGVAASRGRWTVVLLAALSAFCQGAMWNFYSPISTQLTQVYGWSDDDFAWLLNASNIVFVVVCPAWPWLIEKRGLRECMLAAYALLVVSGVIRCVAGSRAQTYRLQFSSMILNGIAAPFCSLMPPAVSAVITRFTRIFNLKSMRFTAIKFSI